MVQFEPHGEDQFRALKQTIQEHYHEKIREVLFALDTNQHYSVAIDMADLVESPLCSKLLFSPHKVLPLLDSILQDVQLELIKTNAGIGNGMPMFLKTKCSARVGYLPAAESKRMTIPNSSDVGKFLSITATVIRTGMVKLLENSKKFYCTTCRLHFDVLADVEQYNRVTAPTRCLATENVRPCAGRNFQMVETPPGQMPEGCRDYQEIKIQEQTNKLTMGTIPGSMLVILHDDLVDNAKSGDDVTITGTVIRRWKAPTAGERCEIELALLANHVFIHNEQRVGVGMTEEHRLEFEQFWERARLPSMKKPFTARNTILRQICPKVYGLYMVKLAVMLVLTGGVQKVDKSGLKVRGEPHLLLVGDPGTGKSQFLKYAAELNPRSVLTTGVGSSSAGLTVTAVRDGNEWQLEAGALVLADRGLCCIDEFGGMREHDKTAIHEAMEQQSISIAKAGIVCKLNTRCSVIAATNPKGKYDPDQPVSINVALASPLLSRFDIVLVLMDTGNLNWDRNISSYLLNTRINMDGRVPMGKSLSRAEVIKRQKRSRMMRRQLEAEANGEDPSQVKDDGSQSDERNIPDDDDEDEEEEEDLEEKPWSLEKLKAYLIWIKSTFEPKLTPPAEQVLVSYYQLQRKADIRNAARTTIRLLESLIRLSQAHARLMAKDYVTVQDAIVVVSLMETTAQGGAAMVGSVNPLHASFPRSGEEEYNHQEKIMLHRLGLSHLSSQEPSVQVDATPGSDDEGRGGDVYAPSEIFEARVKRRREPEHERGDSPPGRRPVRVEASPSGSMVLDDKAEMELLERYRRLDEEEGMHTIKEEEETLIDRRISRRKALSILKGKGKAVDRGQSSSHFTGEAVGEEDEDVMYGARGPNGESFEV